MSEDVERLVQMFHHFAELEFPGESAVYEQLAQVCAAKPELGTPLLAAPRPQRRALLLFAAGQYLLRTVAAAHPLAAYFATLGGTRSPDDQLAAAYADFVSQHREALARLCASRTTQTNEARRSALLRPAFAYAGAGRALGLIELGTSAGLLLLPDRYGYQYTAPTRTALVGRPDAPAVLTMECEIRGGRWPDPVADDAVIGSRTGIDLNPVRPDDEDAVTWLRSCIWPEHVARLRRLDAALAEAHAARPQFIAGEMIECLPAAVSDVESAVLPVVFASHAITYLRNALARHLVEVLAGLGAHRDLVVVLNEAAARGIRHFSTVAPEISPTEAIGTLTVVAWRDGAPTVTSLGYTGPHGAWLSWHPQTYPYLPDAGPP